MNLRIDIIMMSKTISYLNIIEKIYPGSMNNELTMNLCDEMQLPACQLPFRLFLYPNTGALPYV